MTNNEKKPQNIEQVDNLMDERLEDMHLDDSRRIKVLSPGMLVFRRFIRNGLAVVGFVILLFMFSFSFLGTLFSPYGETQVFKGLGTMSKNYAGATYNTELRYTEAAGETFDSAARAQFLLALGKNESNFSSGDNGYFIITEGEGAYRIIQLTPYADVLLGTLTPIGDNIASDEFIIAYDAAEDKKSDTFEVDGVTYYITKVKKATQVSTEHDIALGMINIYDPYNEADDAEVQSFNFKLASSRAIFQGENSFSVDGQTFDIDYESGRTTVYDSAGNAYAEISDIIVNALDQELFLSVPFKSAVRGTIISRENKFEYTHDSDEVVIYTIERVNNTFNIKTETETELIRTYEPVSREHPLGLDNNGMDVMTRLMYGGQVSLLVGFVVIFIQVSIGIVLGGISGYFGGWVDTAIMRFVDLFNSIPFYPLVLIFGSVMDTMEVDPLIRIFLLMVILGLLGWTGVARVVRGQILSLRELDFMVATEATGIRTSRRIFRHLVPNIMPLLIVQATAGLGGIIITEATLGFLGLGVKYPLASWGSIINVASDAFIMTNYWNMWIPAGTLILLTVLGFNFVGDGLRDAFDPKMNR